MDALANPIRAVISAPERVYYRAFTLYARRHQAQARQAAMADPEYARIAAARKVGRDGKALPGVSRFLDDELTMAHWDYQVDLEHKLRPRGWPYRLQWWLDDHGPDHQYRRALTFIQRGRRGYADSDVWNLNHWLSQMIPGALRRLAEINHSWPGSDSPWPQPHDYGHALLDLAERLERISDANWNYDKALPAEERQAYISETFTLFGRIYPHLWD